MIYKIFVFGQDISFECGESEIVLDVVECVGFVIFYFC